MDRLTLESFPFRVLEGMAIAAFAVGAEVGFFFIRSEYPLAIHRIRRAIEMCTEQGILGQRVLDLPFSLRVEVVESAGAFVCGEETALIAALEGGRGDPRARPPYPAEQGLWGKPTLVNNVETLATVPWILAHGVEAFRAAGTPQSPGTKTFALAGKILRGGLIEVPMGMSIRRIVEEIGGGIQEGRRLKAVQIGGPSGGCVPEALADLPVDFESLAAAGAMMGSGGMVVLDESDCMVDVARYFMTFTQRESCGKCVSCRVGTKRMLELLERLCDGTGRPGDLQKLEELALAVKEGSLCGLGRTAPNPVLSTLRYFRAEYEAHLNGRCPAGRCKALIAYTITDDCIGCTRCAQRCPASAIEPKPYEKHRIDESRCIRCGTCRQSCPSEAVRVVARADLVGAGEARTKPAAEAGSEAEAPDA
jgi:NADH-quinone oxidoreductase subunit F